MRRLSHASDRCADRGRIAARGVPYGQHQRPLVGRRWIIERALRKANRRVPATAGVEDIEGCVCRHLAVEADRLSSRERARRLSEAKAWAGVLAIEAQAVTLAELGRRSNRDVATLSNGARQLRERISNNADLADRLAEMQWELMQKTKA